MDHAHLRRIAGSLPVRRGEFADLFLERVRNAMVLRESGIEVPAVLGASEGAAARLLSDDGVRHVSVGGLADGELEALPERLRGALGPVHAGTDRSVAPAGEAWSDPAGGRVGSGREPRGADRWHSLKELRPVSRFLEEIEAAIIGLSRSTVALRVSAEMIDREIVVASSEGEVSEDRRSWIRFSARLSAGSTGRAPGGNVVSVSEGGGAVDIGRLRDLHSPERIASRLAAAIQDRLEASPPPRGETSVVLGPGSGGILFHEACGHALEADRALKGRSAIVDLFGEAVAPADLTLVDDPTLSGLAGSQRIDDEGWPATRNVLIDGGRIVGLLLDRATALLAGTTPTGSARRESYRDLPLPRMTNTFVVEGRCSPEEILASVPRGVYIAELGAGEVDTFSGEFSFTARRASLIADGRVLSPLRPLIVSGNGPGVLRGLRMIGNDLRFDTGGGECGKDGQRARASVGQPTLRVDGLVVQPVEGA